VAIKGLPMASRQGPAPSAPAGTAVPATEDRPAAAPTPAVAAEEPGPAADEPAGSTPPASTAGEEPIRVDEPEPATVARGEGEEEPEDGQAEGDRSLRELFWGED
jgi:hypothetical protein